MISDMPRPRLPNLTCEYTRHGKRVWYHREGHGPRTRIRGVYRSESFMAEYHAAVAGKPTTAPRQAGKSSLRWLVERYMETAAWVSLSHATRRQRSNILKRALEKSGDKPYSDITKKTIVRGRDKRAATPAAARHFIETFRALFAWAVEAELIEANPTEGVKQPKKAVTGYSEWTDEDVAAYRQRWPLGAKERVWLEILIGTGLRRGDAVTFGRQHVKTGVGEIKTEKSQYAIEAYFVMPAETLSAIEAGPTGDLAYICGSTGQPLAKEVFGNYFRKACRAAGVTKSAHGIRKYAATKDAENGWTEAQLMAKFAWSDFKMAAYYVRKANRRKLATQNKPVEKIV